MTGLTHAEENTMTCSGISTQSQNVTDRQMDSTAISASCIGKVSDWQM